MQLKTTLAWALALTDVAADYPWDPKLQVYKIGEVPAMVKRPNRPALWMGRCGGNDVKEGGYACGNFGSKGNVIYKCKGGWLRRREECLWANGTGGQCVRNQRKKGMKYYPLVASNKIVCVQPDDL